MSGMVWSLVWWSKVGDNLDTATRTVAKTGSTFSPSPQSLCMPCGPSLPSLRLSNHQKPLASVKGGKGRRAEGRLVWALQEP